MNFLTLLAIFVIQFATYARNIVFVAPISTQIVWIGIIILSMCAVASMLKEKWSSRRILGILALAITSAAISFLLSDTLFLQVILLAVVCRHMEEKSLIKGDLIAKIIILVIIVTCYELGFTVVNDFIRHGDSRLAMGFAQPNTYAFFISSIFIEYFYLKRDTMKKRDVVIVGAMALAIMSVSKSRTMMILFAAWTLYYFICMFRKRTRKNIKSRAHLIAIMAFIGLTLLSLFSTKAFNVNGNNSKVLEMANSATSGRIAYQKLYLEKYDITPLGNDVDYFVTLDNAYLRLIINFGVIGWLSFLCVYWSMAKKMEKHKNNALKAIPFYYMLMGVMEWYTIRPILNIFICIPFIEESEIKNEKEK